MLYSCTHQTTEGIKGLISHLVRMLLAHWQQLHLVSFWMKHPHWLHSLWNSSYRNQQTWWANPSRYLQYNISRRWQHQWMKTDAHIAETVLYQWSLTWSCWNYTSALYVPNHLHHSWCLVFGTHLETPETRLVLKTKTKSRQMTYSWAKKATQH